MAASNSRAPSRCSSHARAPRASATTAATYCARQRRRRRCGCACSRARTSATRRPLRVADVGQRALATASSGGSAPAHAGAERPQTAERCAGTGFRDQDVRVVPASRTRDPGGAPSMSAVVFAIVQVGKTSASSLPSELGDARFEPTLPRILAQAEMARVSRRARRPRASPRRVREKVAAQVDGLHVLSLLHASATQPQREVGKEVQQDTTARTASPRRAATPTQSSSATRRARSIAPRTG